LLHLLYIVIPGRNVERGRDGLRCDGCERMTAARFIVWPLLALALLPVAPGRADDAAPGVDEAPAHKGVIERTLTEPWRFAVIGWGWAPRAPADIKLGRADAEIPESLDTILDSFQWGAMLDLQARKGPFGAFVAPIVIGLEDSEHFTGPLGERRKVTVEEEVFLMDFGLSFELGRWHLGQGADSPAVTVEATFGGRALLDDISLKINAGPVSSGRSESVDVDFAAPVLGLRTLWDLTERWAVSLEGDYGGFDVDHLDETWNAEGFLGYRFKIYGVSSIVFAGYRYLYIDYSKKAEIEVKIHGPALGLGVYF
jgi:hypothetical protein